VCIGVREEGDEWLTDQSGREGTSVVTEKGYGYSVQYGSVQLRGKGVCVAGRTTCVTVRVTVCVTMQAVPGHQCAAGQRLLQHPGNSLKGGTEGISPQGPLTSH